MENSELIAKLSIVFMCISMGIMLLSPIIFLVIACMKKKADVISFFIGMLAYGISFCFYGFIWCLYVVIASGSFVTTSLPMYYYIVYGVLAGLLSAIGIFLLRKLQYTREIVKGNTKTMNGMVVYSGFAWILGIKTCIPMVDNVRLSLLINDLGIEKLKEKLGDSASRLALEKLFQISSKDSPYYLLIGLEFLLVFVTMLAMGYLLDRTLKAERKMAIAGVAVLAVFQILTELPIQLMRTTNMGIEGKEIMVALVACAAVIFDFVLIQKSNNLNKSKKLNKSEKSDNSDDSDEVKK